MQTLEIVVSGRVQGVSYRFFTLKKANLFNIVGSVKNLSDGSVNVIATGSQANLNLFIDELKRGPSFSRVNNLAYIKVPLRDYDTFRIIY